MPVFRQATCEHWKCQQKKIEGTLHAWSGLSALIGVQGVLASLMLIIADSVKAKWCHCVLRHVHSQQVLWVSLWITLALTCAWQWIRNKKSTNSNVFFKLATLGNINITNRHINSCILLLAYWTTLKSSSEAFLVWFQVLKPCAQSWVLYNKLYILHILSRL